MSLCIGLQDVVAVLLSDGWHTVADRSFESDWYEIYGVGLCTQGAIWEEADGTRVCCALSSVLAIRSKPPQSNGNAPSSPADPLGRPKA